MINYYSVVFTPVTWAEFLEQDKKSIGFRSTLIGSVKKLNVGDVLICYVSERMCWAAALRVTSTHYDDPQNVFSSLHRMQLVIDVDVINALPTESEIPVKEERIWAGLDRFRDINQDSGWVVKVGLHRSLRKFSAKDSEFLLNEISKSINLNDIHSVSKE